MRALLKPVIVREMGLIMLKPGSELLSLFHHGRVLIETPPDYMTRWPSGKVPDARQPLAEDGGLVPFFTDERVIRAAGGMVTPPGEPLPVAAFRISPQRAGQYAA